MDDYKKEASYIEKKYGISSTRPYNNYFEEKIIDRGIEYVSQDRIKQISKIESTINAVISGTEDYNVTVKLNPKNSEIIESAQCNCMYYQDKQLYCKHIYAAVYTFTKDTNLLKARKWFRRLLKKYKKMTNKYLRLNASIPWKYRNTTVQEYTKMVNSYKDVYKKYKKDLSILSVYINFYLSRIRDLDSKINSLNEEIKKIKKFRDKISQNEIGSNTDILLLKLANDILDYTSEKNKKDYILREQIKNWPLNDDEIEAIRSGHYTIDNFDMNNMDEDNYYYDEDEHRDKYY